jgi:hypothetical protein
MVQIHFVKQIKVQITPITVLTVNYAVNDTVMFTVPIASCLQLSPLIYYKIFTHGGLVDINAFAPRDYMKLKKDQRKATINITFDRPNNDNF